MRRAKRKILILVFLDTVFLSAALFAVYWKCRQTGLSPNAPLAQGNLYLLQEEELLKAYKQEITSLDLKRIIPISEIYRQFYIETEGRILPFVLGFLLILILASGWLGVTLVQTQVQSSRRLAKYLDGSADLGRELDDQPELSAALQGLQMKIAGQMEDYRRLYHYLMHEQKNAVALLRITLELSGDQESKDGLDYVADSIEDLLTLSENEDTAVRGEVNVLMVCAQVCDLYRRFYPKIVFNYEEEGDVIIVAKERWIARALSNLIDNAVKYGEGKPIEVSLRTRHQSVIITVRDQGIGIPEQELSRIFNHHYRVNTLKKDGYGIGLSLVSHVCDLSGGYVIAESEPGNGSAFYLSFPGKKNNSGPAN